MFLVSNSSAPSLLSFILPLLGISFCERLRDRGLDCALCIDDVSKHSKSYRQLSLLLDKIPSRDAFPADIFNIHSSLLERCGKLSQFFGSGSVSCFPIIETINSDITEFIATNIISITDGQFYMSRSLFLDACRPAVDTSLSVSRIGSAAQYSIFKRVIVGLKSSTSSLRSKFQDGDSMSSSELISLESINVMFFQRHLEVYFVDTSLLFLFNRHVGNFLVTYRSLVCFLFLQWLNNFYCSYLISIGKTSVNTHIHDFVCCFLK